MPDHISLNVTTQVIFPMLKVCFVEDQLAPPPLGVIEPPVTHNVRWRTGKPKLIALRSISTKVKLYPGCAAPNWEDLLKPQLVITHFPDGTMLYMMGRGEYLNDELTVTPDNTDLSYMEPWIITPSYMDDENDEDQDEE